MLKVMKKILYLHGLESSNVCDKVDFMRERANVLAPSLNYRKPNIEEELMYMVESFQPDFIIGSSMGGYVGSLLANYYGIQNLLFNPAIHSRSIEPKLSKLLTEQPNYFIDFNIVFGKNDDVIDPEISKEILFNSEVHVNFDEVDMGHRVDYNVFIDMYNKYVK